MDRDETNVIGIDHLNNPNICANIIAVELVPDDTPLTIADARHLEMLLVPLLNRLRKAQGKRAVILPG